MGAQFIPRLLAQLKDVLVTSPTNNQVLTYETSSGLWKNKTGAGGGGASSITVTDGITEVTPAATLQFNENYFDVSDAGSGIALVTVADSAFAFPLERQALTTSSGTAGTNQIIPVDTTGGNVTITLPAAPADEVVVAVRHVTQGGTNTVTLTRGGSDVFNKVGGPTSLTLTLLGQSVVVQYDAISGIWSEVTDGLTLASIDLRYQPLDGDLTAIAALTTTSYGRAVLALADAAALRTAAGLGTAATQNTTAFDAAGAAAAAQAASQPVDSDLTAIAALTTTSYGRALLTAANLAALYTTLGVDTDGTLAANSDTALPTQKAVKTYADALIAANDAMVFKGVIDCSLNPNYPAANRGDTYRVSVAGKIGGASGTNVEIGDLLICLTDGTSSGTQAGVGSSWTITQTNIDGAYVAGGTDVAVADGGTGASTAAGARTNLGLAIGTDVQAFDADLSTYAGITPSANIQSILGAANYAAVRSLLSLVVGTNVQAWDADLDTYAGITPSANVQSVLGAANYAAIRTLLTLVPGTDVQAYDAELAALAGLTSAADKVPYFTGAGTAAVADLTATGRSLIDDTSTSAMRTTLGLVIGTDVQAQDAELAAIAGLVSAADKVPYFTGAGTAAVTDLTATGRSIIDDTSTSAVRTTLGLVIGTDVEAHDTDLTTFAGLTPTNDDIVQRKAGAWANRTIAQLLTDLAAAGTTFQPLDSDLTALAGLAIAADTLPYGNGSHTMALATFTAAGRALVDDADAAAQRTTLGLGTIATVAAPSGTVVGTSDTQTLTNKRVTKRTGTTTSSATPTINTDNVDFYSLTAQTADITSFTTNLSGTPTENQTLWIAITGTAARAITWGTSFEASTVALPTTTVTTARLDVGFVWNTVTSKWRCVASG